MFHYLVLQSLFNAAELPQMWQGCMAAVSLRGQKWQRGVSGTNEHTELLPLCSCSAWLNQENIYTDIKITKKGGDVLATI